MDIRHKDNVRLLSPGSTLAVRREERRGEERRALPARTVTHMRGDPCHTQVTTHRLSPVFHRRRSLISLSFLAHRHFLAGGQIDLFDPLITSILPF